MLPFSIFVVAGWHARKPVLLLLIAALGLVLLSCGGSSGGGGVTPPGNHLYTAQVRMQTARGTEVVTIDVAKVTVTVQR
jgi:hypothetical protein